MNRTEPNFITKFNSNEPEEYVWAAYWPEDKDDTRHWGWGPTEQEAIADLHRLDQERQEAENDQLRWETEGGAV